MVGESRQDSSGGLKGALATIAISAMVLGVLYLAGFMYFTHQVINLSNKDPEPADGIVVLTGGPARIASGVRLLDEGKAERLLISGVYEATTPKAIASQIEGSQKYFDCCIDLGKSALNTTGNAVEAAEWARGNGYKNLIVVTAAYHLPRSLVEFNHYMPDIKLIPYAVVPEQQMKPAVSAGDGQWLNTTRLSLMFSEYSKYLLAIGTNLLSKTPKAAAQ